MTYAWQLAVRWGLSELSVADFNPTHSERALEQARFDAVLERMSRRFDEFEERINRALDRFERRLEAAMERRQW